MKRRNFLTLVSTFILTLLLFHFQNCAPAGGALATQASSRARLIEDLNKAQIQFVASEVEIQDAAPSTGIDGWCNRDHDGAGLKWSVSVGQALTTELLKGQSVCGHGQFSVIVSQLDQLVCGVSHLLVVESTWGGSTFTHLSRRCQPLASQTIATPSESPAGTTCSIEYLPASVTENRCQQVCYRDQKVVQTLALAVGHCSVLAAGLASQ